MSRNFQDILNTLPERLPRSRLEPYRDLIGELRRRRRTYRQIVSILAEKCDLSVSVSTLHDFVRLRSQAARKVAKDQRTTNPFINAREIEPQTKVKKEEISTTDDLRRQISALRQRAAPTESHPSQRFEYDPCEPLRLPKDVQEW
jgi:hypothetical protein